MFVVMPRNQSAAIHHGKKPHKGFSLLELMIVVSIVAIFAGIGVPSFSHLIANQRVHTAASDLQTALWRARSEAIRLNTQVVLAPAISAVGWESGWVATNPRATSQELISHAALSGVTLTTPRSAAASVTYRPSGRATSTMTIEVASKTDSGAEPRCIRIDLGGRPLMRKGGC